MHSDGCLRESLPQARQRGLDRNLATSASANLRRVLIDTHTCYPCTCTVRRMILPLREPGPSSHTTRVGTVSLVCLTFPMLWLSAVSRLKVSPCQVHHVLHSQGSAELNCFPGSNRRSPEALRPCFTWSGRLRVTQSMTHCCDASFFRQVDFFWHSRTACPERQLGLERDGNVGVGFPLRLGQADRTTSGEALRLTPTSTPSPEGVCANTQYCCASTHNKPSARPCSALGQRQCPLSSPSPCLPLFGCEILLRPGYASEFAKIRKQCPVQDQESMTTICLSLSPHDMHITICSNCVISLARVRASPLLSCDAPSGDENTVGSTSLVEAVCDSDRFASLCGPFFTLSSSRPISALICCTFICTRSLIGIRRNE